MALTAPYLRRWLVKSIGTVVVGGIFTMFTLQMGEAAMVLSAIVWFVVWFVVVALLFKEMGRMIEGNVEEAALRNSDEPEDTGDVATDG